MGDYSRKQPLQMSSEGHIQTDLVEESEERTHRYLLLDQNALLDQTVDRYRSSAKQWATSPQDWLVYQGTDRRSRNRVGVVAGG